MLTDGEGTNGLAFVYDEASEQDSIDSQLLRSWSPGIQAIGRTQWHNTLRIALREHGTDPWTAKTMRENKPQLEEKLDAHGIKVAVVMQSPATPGVRQVHAAFNMLAHAGNPFQWAGTAEEIGGRYVCPILHPVNYEYIYGYLTKRWLVQAYELAQGRLSQLPFPQGPHCLIEPNEDMRALLLDWLKTPCTLSLDIETNMAGTIVTAIGLSDGTYSISTPWHRYELSNVIGQQKALASYPCGDAIQKSMVQILQSDKHPKILHNGTFDVIQLAQYGIHVQGFTWDTLLLHRVIYPQFRHGLQQACATEFCVAPWKTLHKPPRVARDKDPWMADAEALRRYNARDAFATWHLWNSLLGKLG